MAISSMGLQRALCLAFAAFAIVLRPVGALRMRLKGALELHKRRTAATAKSWHYASSQRRLGWGLSRGKNDAKVDSGRIFRYYVPKSYKRDEKTALFFVFHGTGLNPACSLNNFGHYQLAEAFGYIAVAGASEGKNWNIGNNPDIKTDDVQFFRDMVWWFKERTLVDSDAIVVSGFSRGGYMTYRLACEASDLVAMAGIVSGGLIGTCDTQVKPVPLVHFHGVADRNVPHGCSASAIVRYKSLSSMNCVGKPRRVFKLGNVTCNAYMNCNGGATVRLCSFDNMRHSWPGGRKYCATYDEQSCCGCGAPDGSLDAVKYIWNQFKKYVYPLNRRVPSIEIGGSLLEQLSEYDDPEEEGPVSEFVPCGPYGCAFCPNPDRIPADKCGSDPFGGCDGSACTFTRYVKPNLMPDWLRPTAEPAGNLSRKVKLEDAAQVVEATGAEGLGEESRRGGAESEAAEKNQDETQPAPKPKRRLNAKKKANAKEKTKAKTKAKRRPKLKRMA